MRRLWIVPSVSFVLALAPALRAEPPKEKPVVVERVVAVVGHEAIFSTELAARMKPITKQLEGRVPEGPQRAAATEQATRALLDQLIDERLIAAAADMAKISVSREEVDRALEAVASSQKLTLAELLRAASDQGLSEAEYRAELRRQLLEGKLLARAVNQRAKGGTPLTGSAFNAAMAKERERILNGLRERTFIEKRL